MKALTILFAISLSIAVWGCSDQTSVIESNGGATAVHDSKIPINSGGEVLVNEVVYSASLKASYRVTGTLIYDIVPKDPHIVVTTGLALSVENEDPAKNEAYNLIATNEQEVNTKLKAFWFASESHSLGEDPTAGTMITLKYRITEESLSVDEISVDKIQIGNHW